MVDSDTLIQPQPEKPRMYILIRDAVPLSLAITAAAHASLSCYLRNTEALGMQHWVNTSFKKVVCRVNDTEFEAARSVPGCEVITESALDGAATALAFTPRPTTSGPNPSSSTGSTNNLAPIV